ncbi:MAG: cob(I)yrinic acid a,c-diamide adenosyltransferase [Thermoleophilia bacterium]
MCDRTRSRLSPITRPQPPGSLVLLNTGDGKGKSTAAWGVVLRALAEEWPVCVIQFLKSEDWRSGEEVILRKLGVTWVKGGDGFTWESSDLGNSEQQALSAWWQAAEALESGRYRLVVLDEVTYPVAFGWIGVDELVDAIRSRSAGVNVIVTGRHAPEELVAVADAVTDMVKVSHPFDRGVLARAGIDF